MATLKIGDKNMKANTAREIRASINMMINALNIRDTKSIEKYNNAISAAIESEREYQKELTNIAIYLKGNKDLIIKAMGEKILSLI